MNFMVNIDIKKLPQPISYRERMLLVGSCFTEHIGNALGDLKFQVLQNPNGILFDPASVCKSLVSYTNTETVKQEDLFQLNETWHSWDYHSRFSNVKSIDALQNMNASQQQAHAFLKTADWLVITLGSSFSYRLSQTGAIASESMKQLAGHPGIANCHRAPARWFDKHLLEIDETISLLDDGYHRLKQFNPKLRIIFTVSPVRHLRDGVIENNRSKARLIEAVHHLVNKFEGLYYFPAYELVVDVLRDYRFYDIDLAHPNYMATSYVMEKFIEACIDEQSQQVMEDVRKVVTAKKHRPFQPSTEAHRQFLDSHAKLAQDLMKKYPFLDLDNEIDYFTAASS